MCRYLFLGRGDLAPTLSIIIICILLSACGVQPPTPFPTDTPTATLPPTATTVWFPPTETPTPRPTVERSPTPDLRAGLGAVILEDDFSDGADWALSSTTNTSAAVVNGHLTLALSNSRSYLFTLRTRPSLYNFYAEITASPNLCAGADEYGLMLRVTGNLDYYRFSVTCDGRAKVERRLNDRIQLLVPAVQHGAIPLGSPSSSTLAVWAEGDEIRFFINGQELFRVTDRVLGAGSLGVFVRTVGDSVVSVNFSDLVVYELAP